MATKKLSKTEAIAEARTYGIIFDGNEHNLSISDKTFLSELAKRTTYRKSRTSSYTLGVSFYIHLMIHL